MDLTALDFNSFKMFLVCFGLGLIVGFTIGFGMGKKDVNLEKGISLIMFAVWLVALIMYPVFDNEVPSLLNLAGFGATVSLMGVQAGNTIREYLLGKIVGK